MDPFFGTGAEKKTESKQSIRSFEKTQRIYTPEFSTANS